MWETIIIVIMVLVGCFMFIFNFWRELKEDYIASQIFSTSIFVLFVISTSYLFSEYYFKNFRFLIITFSLFFGYFIASRKFGIKFFEGLDSLVLAGLYALLTSSVILYRFWEIKWIIFYGTVGISIIVFHLIKNNYKSFIWYGSGRRGFSGLFTIGIFFLVRSVFVFINPGFLLMLNTYDIFISGLLSFISFLNIFVLAKH